MLVSLIPSLVLQERAKLQRSALGKLKWSYLQVCFKCTGTPSLLGRCSRCQTAGPEAWRFLGSVQNFYNHRDALFNTLKIDRLRRVAKTPDGLWLWTWSSFRVELQCGLLGFLPALWRWLTSGSLVQVLMSSCLTPPEHWWRRLLLSLLPSILTAASLFWYVVTVRLDSGSAASTMC